MTLLFNFFLKIDQNLASAFIIIPLTQIFLELKKFNFELVKKIILHSTIISFFSLIFISFDNVYRPDAGIYHLPFTKIINDFKKLSLQNISFRYSKGEPLIFNDISLDIYKGEKVGIVGITGGGKSTLIDLILGLLKPESGQILIDENNMENVKNSWQKMISHVPQDVYYSDDSFAKNIAFGTDIKNLNQDKLINASKDAFILDYILQQDDKFEHILGESGVQLSGGQKQRLGIARALYKDSNIIIFDEATSALDEKTEKDVVNSIQAIDSKKTVLIIAHRLSTIKHADRIVCVENGKIITFNSFEEYEKEKLSNI